MNYKLIIVLGFIIMAVLLLIQFLITWYNYKTKRKMREININLWSWKGLVFVGIIFLISIIVIGFYRNHAPQGQQYVLCVNGDKELVEINKTIYCGENIYPFNNVEDYIKYKKQNSAGEKNINITFFKNGTRQ